MSRWIHSPVFDGVLIVGPAVVSVLLVLFVPALRAEHLPAWGWLAFVVGIDVAHVWSSLYRTYLDPDEFQRRRTHYVVTPLLCFGAGVVLYSLGSLAFWRVLAYLAVLHFVRQQYGFVMLYRHRAGERGGVDAVLDKVAIYTVMLYPLAYWHTADDRVFAWFIPGDFVTLPAWTAGAAGALSRHRAGRLRAAPDPAGPPRRATVVGKARHRDLGPPRRGTSASSPSTRTSPSR